MRKDVYPSLSDRDDDWLKKSEALVAVLASAMLGQVVVPLLVTVGIWMLVYAIAVCSLMSLKRSPTRA
jgi:hypothetical protein